MLPRECLDSEITSGQQTWQIITASSHLIKGNVNLCYKQLTREGIQVLSIEMAIRYWESKNSNARNKLKTISLWNHILTLSWCRIILLSLLSQIVCYLKRKLELWSEKIYTYNNYYQWGINIMYLCTYMFPKQTNEKDQSNTP